MPGAGEAIYDNFTKSSVLYKPTLRSRSVFVRLWQRLRHYGLRLRFRQLVLKRRSTQNFFPSIFYMPQKSHKYRTGTGTRQIPALHRKRRFLKKSFVRGLLSLNYNFSFLPFWADLYTEPEPASNFGSHL